MAMEAEDHDRHGEVRTESSELVLETTSASTSENHEEPIKHRHHLRPTQPSTPAPAWAETDW